MITTVFFDRDGTIAKANTTMHKKRDVYIGSLIDDPDFILSNKVKGLCWNETSSEIDPIVVETLEEEEEFWCLFNRILLDEIGYKGNINLEAKKLYKLFPFYKMVEPYDDVIRVFKTLKEKNINIGIISDTFPSLELSIAYMGLDDYVDCCISSNEVGVYKPEAEIYQVGMAAFDVKSDVFIYVDDIYSEAQGGKAVGMQGVWINRDNESLKDQESLEALVDCGTEKFEVMVIQSLEEIIQLL